jgi:hypothetical protein
MKHPKISLEIGRIVLDGFDLTPLQAEQVRNELQTELSNRLKDLPGRVSSVAVDRATAKPLSWSGPFDNVRLANELAEEVVQTVSQKSRNMEN